MALTSTLFTGLSGLDVNQTRLNVVGNNIANVNTVAFKGSRALFKPQFYITDAAGTPPGNNNGGTNPSQRGLGAALSAIEKNFDPGTIEPTGKATDLAIDGQGFFIVRGNEQFYTRDGSFVLNQANQLVTVDGKYVQGFGVDDNGQVIAGGLQNVEIPIGSLTQARATTRVNFQGNLNANGEIAAGASILNSQALTTAASTAPTAASLLTDLRAPGDLITPLVSAGQTFTVAGKRGGRDLPALTYSVTPGSTVGEFLSFLSQGLGVDTSVPPPAGAPTPGASVGATPGDPAGTARLILTGNVGAANALSLAGAGLQATGGNPFLFNDGQDTLGTASNPIGESVFTSFEAYDSLGTPLTVNATVVLENKGPDGTTWRMFASSADDTDHQTFDPLAPGMVVGSATLEFDNNGKLRAVNNNTLSITRENTGAATPLAIEMNFDQLTSLTDSISNLAMSEQDGSRIGTLSGFSVGRDGTIVGSFSNGLTRNLGRIAIASFDNPAGLNDRGGNMYTTGANSGLPIVTSPGQLGSGEIQSSALELSNVDLSNEFINMIIASTGFSASSRVISTADRLMTELLQTTR